MSKKMLTDGVREVFKEAFIETSRCGSDKIEVEHVLICMLVGESNIVIDTLVGMDIDVVSVINELQRPYKKNKKISKLIPFSEEVKSVISTSELESDKIDDEYIDLEHVFMAIMKNKSSKEYRLLSKKGVSYTGFKKTLLTIKKDKDIMTDGYEDFNQELNKKIKKGNSSLTPILDGFSRDITKLAREGEIDPIIGRDNEIERVSQVLSRRKKNNPILIGEPGVGKTAIVEGLALKIVNKKCPRILFNMRVVSLDLGLLIAGTKYRGQFEERMKGIMGELKEVDDVILFIDEIHTMVGAGNTSGSMDASNMLKPALSRAEIQCIGATTLNEFRENIEKDGALDRRFQKVLVNPPSVDETLTILKNIKGKYEDHHKVSYTDDAIETCVRLADRYVTDREQPDKSIDIMDEVGARAQVKIEPSKKILKLESKLSDVTEKKTTVVKEQKYEEAAKLRDEEKKIQEELEFETELWREQVDYNRKEINSDDVCEVVSVITGVPVTKIGDDETRKLIEMESNLKKDVIGQDEAISQITMAIKRSRIGIGRKDKPMGSFMFLGPTGVGKTHLAKMLAEGVFGSEDSLIRVDMSEYMEKHAVSKLVGSPPGYVGYEEGGQLTEKVRRKPYSVILLDEVEKAHPDVFNILLQVLDDGHLTDSLGRKVNFKNTMIIMTSNVGARKLQDFGTGAGYNTKSKLQMQEKLTSEVIQSSLKKSFSPEFLNRLDDIVVFNKLSKENIKKMVDLSLKDLIESVNEMGYTIKITPNMKNHLSEVGYDEKYGARPLARAVQRYIEDPVAERMLLGDVEEGDTIKVGYSREDVSVDIIKK